MDTSTHILVIILSVMLGFFLLLSIIIALFTIRLLIALRGVVRKAEAIVETAENVGKIFQDVSGPLAIARLVRNVVETVSHHNKRSK